MLKSLLIDFKGSYHNGDNYTFWYNVERSATVSTDIHVLNYGTISKASCWYDVPNRRLYVNGVEGYFSMAGHTMTFVSVPDRTNDILDFLSTTDFIAQKSGNPVQFNSTAGNIKELVVTLTPTQSGSGEPSPSNVRPISGATSVTVTRTGENGANPQTVTVQLTDGSDPLTVYGGTLDVTTGVLTVTWGAIDLGAMSWNYVDSNGGFFESPIIANGLPIRPLGYDVLCDTYAAGRISANNFYSKDYVLTAFNSNLSSSSRFYVRDSRYNNAADFTTAMSGHYVVYPLATPVTYQLTPAQLPALDGNNIVYTNGDKVTINTIMKFEV